VCVWIVLVCIYTIMMLMMMAWHDMTWHGMWLLANIFCVTTSNFIVWPFFLAAFIHFCGICSGLTCHSIVSSFTFSIRRSCGRYCYCYCYYGAPDVAIAIAGGGRVRHDWNNVRTWTVDDCCSTTIHQNRDQRVVRPPIGTSRVLIKPPTDQPPYLRVHPQKFKSPSFSRLISTVEREPWSHRHYHSITNA